MNDTDQIEVKSEVLEAATIVKPIGEIDLSRAPSLRHHLNEAQASKPGSLATFGDHPSPKETEPCLSKLARWLYGGV